MAQKNQDKYIYPGKLLTRRAQKNQDNKLKVYIRVY